MSGDCEEESNYDRCIDRLLYQVLKEEVNCTVPWVTNNNNICKVYQCLSIILSCAIILINSSDQTQPESRIQTIPRESEKSEKTM